MWVCSCNVISDTQFKTAVDAKKEEISATPSIKKAVGIVYHAARTMQEEEKRPLFRKPCRSCFNTVASYIQQAGHFPNEGMNPCGRDCGGCSLTCS